MLGVDFTGQPGRSKPLTVAEGWLEEDRLEVSAVTELTSFSAYDEVLAAHGPWVAAVDHPFGLPRGFVEAVGWPQRWAALMAHLAGMERAAFRQAVADFTAPRPAGRKYLLRRTEELVRFAASPLNLVNPPVGLMLFAGAPRLLAAGVTVAPCRPDGDPERVVVEGYPAAVARRLIGSLPYKSGGWRSGRARMELLDALPDSLAPTYGVHVDVTEPCRTNALLDDRGDLLDAILCAAQAAWATRQPHNSYGIPPTADPLEGWIADPLSHT